MCNSRTVRAVQYLLPGSLRLVAHCCCGCAVLCCSSVRSVVWRLRMLKWWLHGMACSSQRCRGDRWACLGCCQ
jgi:hypothetical protein